MKLLLVGPNSGEWNAADRPQWRDYQSGFEAWCFCPGVEASYCNAMLATPEKINQYDIVMVGAGNLREAYSIVPQLLRLQSVKNPNVKWVTMFDDARDCLPVTNEIRALCDGADLVNVLNEHAVEFFRSITKTRCENLGIPYPGEAVRRFGKITAKDIFIASRFYHPPFAELESLIAPALAEEHGVSVYQMVKAIPESGNTRIHYYEEKDMPSYLSLLARSAKVFIDLDFRYTWGRDVLDCAALRIPCIATRTTAHANRLFPELTVEDMFDIEGVKNLVRRLYSDKDFYQRRANIPIEWLEPYSHSSMLTKLLSYL